MSGLAISALDGAAAAERDGLLDLLGARGVVLGARGCPVADGAAAIPHPLQPAVPQSQLLSQFLRRSADVAFGQLLADTAPDDQVRLRSASGPTAGSLYAADLCALVSP